MPMFDNTMPRAGDELGDAFRKVNQILDSGARGAITPVPYPNAYPENGDELTDSARKINQIIHVNGGI